MPGAADEDEPEITRRQDGSYLVDGSLTLDQFGQELGFDLESFRNYETVAGLVLDRMGTIPHAGDKCNWDDFIFEVLDMDGNRIDKILVTRAPAREGTD
jgi:putative hemolysin